MQLGTAPHSKNNNAARSLVNSKNCPVTATSKKNTMTLMAIEHIL